MTATALALAAADAPRRPDGFRVETRRDAKLRFTMDGKQSVWTVTSPNGIGSATVERTAASWPETVVLRMHLKGLESLRVSNGRATLEIAASSTQDHAIRANLERGRKSEPIDRKSAHWPKVRIVDASGKIPLDGGHFEVTLPAALFEDDPQRITLHWVDFYRG